jgi:hypothetical protein
MKELKSRYQETTTESNTYQDRITTLQNELNYECANAEALQTTAGVAGAAFGQQPHVQPVSIPDHEKFNSYKDKLQSFVSHLHMKLAGDASCFPNLQH